MKIFLKYFFKAGEKTYPKYLKVGRNDTKFKTRKYNTLCYGIYEKLNQSNWGRPIWKHVNTNQCYLLFHGKHTLV